MLKQGVEPNCFTFSALLKDCPLGHGKLLHGQAIEFGFDCDLYVRTGPIDVYARAGDVCSAQQLFVTMPKRSLVSLTAMMTCYAKHGKLDEARMLFDEMRDRDLVCWNVMIDGYTQHGMPNQALLLFRKMLRKRIKLGALESDKDVVAWNSMIVGYAMHGFSQDALELFNKMLEIGYYPSDISFIGVLSACAYAGHLEEAYELIKNMKIDPDPVLWGTLLGACRLHNNATLREEIAEYLVRHDLANSGTYILLSNIYYAAVGNWEGVAKVRGVMKESVIQKEPGDKKHPKSKEIYKMLEEMNGWLKAQACHGFWANQYKARNHNNHCKEPPSLFGLSWRYKVDFKDYRKKDHNEIMRDRN
ncbi:hypothetical protein G4B88_026862 [Cannabis sativa]|uniref:Pentatricopeptide repeat-containing protein n=1 Tax=Cannabis sativa TaxID=3483 RepID=A0A7J6EB52_CANSA|nr:hypothetical protein G4B88_026862 [Cannabis sativa]